MFGINTCYYILYIFVSSTCTVIRYKETKEASFQKTTQQLRRWSPYCPRQHLWRIVDPQIRWPQYLWVQRLVLQWFLSFRLCMLKASEKYHGYFTSAYSDIQPPKVHCQTFLSVKPISHARDWEWVSRLRRSSLLCSRVPFCPFFELKDVIPRYARSRETIFRALLLKRNRGKGVLWQASHEIVL